MQYMNDLKGRRLGRMKVEFIEDGDEDHDFNANFDNEGKDYTSQERIWNSMVNIMQVFGKSGPHTKRKFWQ